jgi:hypothetical protein
VLNLTRLALAFMAAATFVLVTGVAASNIVPASHAGATFQGVAANSLKPTPCGGLNLSVVVNGPGDSGATANQLLLAGPADTAVVGGSGDDCIVASSDVATIDGGTGTNVCFGGSTTVFTNCQTQVVR